MNQQKGFNSDFNQQIGNQNPGNQKGIQQTNFDAMMNGGGDNMNNQQSSSFNNQGGKNQGGDFNMNLPMGGKDFQKGGQFNNNMGGQQQFNINKGDQFQKGQEQQFQKGQDMKGDQQQVPSKGG